MPRKAAPTSAKSTPLDGYTIAVAGTFPGVTQAALRARIEALGAGFAAIVTADTSYLICTDKDFENNSAKAKAAAANDVPALGIGWLDECETTDSHVDVLKFLLSSQKNANASKKRAANEDSTQSKKPKLVESSKISEVAKVGDGQNAKSQRITISMDEHCPLANYQVYIDQSDGTIFDASLNQTNSQANNNKFYKVQLLQNGAGTDFKTWTRWGRVGETGQNAMLGGGSLGDAMRNFEKKFKDKSGLKWEDRGKESKSGKYAYVERSYNPDSDEEEEEASEHADGTGKAKEPVKMSDCTLDQPTQNLMELIFNQQYFQSTMNALNYDANKLPLGKLSKATIARGFQALKDLSSLLDNTNRESIERMCDLSNRYFSVIPHDFGRTRPPVIRDNDTLKKEIELLESLSDMKEAADMLKASLKDDSGVHRLDKQFQGLNMNEMTTLDHKSQEFIEIDNYLNKSKGATHHINYRIQEVFRIERQGEFDRFEQSKYAKIKSNRRLLWHGSRVTNFGGILGQGLRIAPPEAPVSGYMFGKGIYLADMSSKSANYCNSHNSGGTALLLLCEAELGDPMHELIHSSYAAGEDALAKNSYSTWGMGRTGPSRWKDAGCMNAALKGCMMPDVSTPAGDTNVPGAHLQYNEYIVYDIAQVRLRYLLHVQM